MTTDGWAFDEPEDRAVVTLKEIAQGEAPILLVFHEKGDGDWLFLDGAPFSVENASLVPLRSLVKLDPSLVELAKLPPGWTAKRTAPGEPWKLSASAELADVDA